VLCGGLRRHRSSGFRPCRSASKLFNLRWPVQVRLGRAICVADVSSGD
jgi:hypothetical protein